jgi:NTE family protein
MKLVKRKQKRAKKIGLALGSGSARGWAHIGVIKALNEAGINVDFVSGTSVGAVVGAVYASGAIHSFEEVVLQLDWKRVVSFLDVVFPKSGLIDGNKIADFVRIHVGNNDFADLSLPFRAVSTDLTTGTEVVIQEGDIIEAVRASISIPGIFTPLRKEGKTLVDGGLVNPVPVSVVREMGADLVIGVDLNHDTILKKGVNRILSLDSIAGDSDKQDGRILGKKNKILEALNKKIRTLDFPAFTQIMRRAAGDPLPNIFEVLLTSSQIMQAQITASRLKAEPPDILIQPKLGHLRFLDFHRAAEAIFEGYRETKSCIELSSLRSSLQASKRR